MEIFIAYIDPGSGSLIIQALIAGLVAVPILFRRHVARIVHVLRGQPEQVELPATTDDPAPGA